MKLYIKLILILFFSNVANAQLKDSVKYEVIYKVAKLGSDTAKSLIEQKILIISPIYSLEKNYDMLKFVYTDRIKYYESIDYEKRFGKNPLNQVKESALTTYPEKQLLYDLTKKNLMFFRMPGTYMYYERSMEKFEWKISDEQIQVAGYMCQKAYGTTAKGEKWEVWFTKELPYSIGLGGMSGLTGLILKGSGGASQLSFEATEVYKGSRFFSYLERSGNNFRKVSKEELEAAREKLNKNIEEFRKVKQ